MDSFEINKFVACLLVVALVFIGLANFGEILYHVDKPEVAHYKIEGVDDGVSTAASELAVPAVAEPLEDIRMLLASADIGKGEKVFKKCAQCHVLDKGGANKIGPALWDIVNKKVGGKEDYKYSNALASYEGNWSYEELNGFLLNPKKYIEGTKMSFAGLKKSSDRANVILYMREFSDSPAPIE